jgi:hypothetical protein
MSRQILFSLGSGAVPACLFVNNAWTWHENRLLPGGLIGLAGQAAVLDQA